MKFSKYQGAGNDFIVIEDRGSRFLPNQIKQLCDRRYGIGGDGLILTRKGSCVDAHMEIFNADGTQAEMCGNGLRCLAYYLIDEGLKKEKITIQVGEKVYTAQQDGDDMVIDMGQVQIIEEDKTLEGLSYYHINSGVPHLVHFSEDIDREDFVEVAKALRNHKHFSPSGVNVNFVRLSSSHLFEVRTYERGVEDETLSCGTGATAVCVAAWKKYGLYGNLEVEFRSKERLQFDLLVSDALLVGIYMRGQATRIFQGEVRL